MREETRQHEGTLTWELFQSTLIEHFYHIPSKERATSLLNKLQQDPHKNIGEYIQRSSKIIQVHSGKTNLKEIAASQYGWNLVQGLTNISIKNKIADRICRASVRPPAFLSTIKSLHPNIPSSCGRNVVNGAVRL